MREKKALSSGPFRSGTSTQIHMNESNPLFFISKKLLIPTHISYSLLEEGRGERRDVTK